MVRMNEWLVPSKSTINRITLIMFALLFTSNICHVTNGNSTNDQDDVHLDHQSRKDYTNHSVVKISETNIHLLFEPRNSSNDHSEHEILWFDNVDRNAYVRLGPNATARVKRDIHRTGNPIFLTSNLQSWIDAEQGLNNNHNNIVHRTRPQSSSSFPTFDDMIEEDSVGTTIRNVDPLMPEESHRSRIIRTFILNQYYPLSKVYQFLDDIEDRTNGITVFTIGHTHEGIPIKAIEILNNPSDGRFIWIDACTHAREWVTVTTALYLIEQTIVHKVPMNFIIVPVLNVDGYVYTWEKDRMWRKNRRPYSASRLAVHNMPDRCNGVDLNRNYDINFGGEGSSSSPCSYLYQGPHPFSEPEVKAVSDLLAKNRHRIKMTLSLHSFNQLWASPNAFTTARTKDHEHHMRVLKAVQQAVASTNGVTYEIGPLGASLYLGSGFMMDWIYHKLGIRDAYLVELRDKGYHGFVLPAKYIWPTATETWAGLRAAIRMIFNV
ncbi:hypothetical protein BLOT_005768 [Blomia tropicalis]|nr:hypothetical protein BLOT_005768 [Blomia tropicalis]